MNTIITGLGLALLGACIGIGGHAAGVAWGKTRRCPTAWTIRILCGLVVYGVVGLFTVRGFTGAAAQTFSQDSQLVATTGGRGAGSLWQQQMTELVSFMRAQELLEARRVGDREDVLRRISNLELIHPDALALQIKNIEDKLTKQEATSERTNQLLFGLLLAFLGTMFSSWLASRKK